MRLRGKSAGMATRLLCAIALLLLSFGHAPMAAASASADSTEYVLPDGSVPTLCSPSSAVGGKVAVKPGCDVCRLAASIDLPTPGDGVYLIVRQAFLTNPLATEAAVLGVRPQGRPKSRGPPQQA